MMHAESRDTSTQLLLRSRCVCLAVSWRSAPSAARPKVPGRSLAVSLVRRRRGIRHVVQRQRRRTRHRTRRLALRLMHGRPARNRRRHAPDSLRRFGRCKARRGNVMNARLGVLHRLVVSTTVVGPVEARRHLRSVERREGRERGLVDARRKVVLSSATSILRLTCMSTTRVPSPSPRRSIKSSPPIWESCCCCSPSRAAMPPAMPECSSSG